MALFVLVVGAVFLYIQKLNDWTTPGKMLAKLVIIRVTFETSVEKLKLLNTLNLMNWKWFSFLYAIILPRVILSDIFYARINPDVLYPRLRRVKNPLMYYYGSLEDIYTTCDY